MEEQEILSILAKNNSISRKEAKSLKIRYRNFYKKVFKGLECSELARQAVFNVQKLETSVWNQYKRVMYKYLHTSKHKILDKETYGNLLQDAFRDAVYTYSRSDIRFTTYLVHVLKNRTLDFLNKQTKCIPTISISDNAQFAEKSQNKYAEMALEAFRESDLTPLQKQIVEHRMFGRKFIDFKEINPKNGRLFTVAELHYQHNIALGKIKTIYLRMAS